METSAEMDELEAFSKGQELAGYMAPLASASRCRDYFLCF